MSSPPLFLDLPPEIRDMIYDLIFEDEEARFSNVLTTRTAYTPKTCPLLYVHPLISNELQPRLYQNHTIVVPIQEPSEYATAATLLSPQLDKASRLMKARAQTLIIEASQTRDAYYPDAEEDSDGDLEIAHDFWDESGGELFAEKIMQELRSMKAQLPDVYLVKFIFWCGNWHLDYRMWEAELDRLQVELPNVTVEFQLNLFGYNDPDAGDGGSNWVQGWTRVDEKQGDYTFAAMDLRWTDETAESFHGHEFDVTGWEHPYINTMSQADRDRALHFGSVECRPLFVLPGPGRW